MNIQIDTTEELHKFLKIEKIKRDKVTLAETVIELLEESKQKKEGIEK